MNTIESLEQDLESLYAMYRKHPESAEEIAREIQRLEEYILMCYDSRNIHKYLGETA